MNGISDRFYHMASERLAAHPSLSHSWSIGSKGKRVLTIPKAEDSGYDIRIECESYGLYPYAGGWHGAPWDAHAPGTTDEAICEECLGFIRSLLCEDASLTVCYAGRMPYKWILNYPSARGPISDATGLLFYNFFGHRHQKVLVNRHLPPRETA